MNTCLIKNDKVVSEVLTFKNSIDFKNYLMITLDSLKVDKDNLDVVMLYTGVVLPDTIYKRLKYDFLASAAVYFNPFKKAFIID